mgnify:CR=1 FL=1
MKINKNNTFKNSQNKDLIIYISSGIIITILIIIVIVFARKLYINNHPEAMSESEIIRERVDDYSDATYIGECDYDGADVSKACFNVEFISEEQASAEGFESLTNKEFLESYGITSAENMENYATSYLENIFGNNYRDVMADTNSFIKTYTGNISATSVFYGDNIEETDEDTNLTDIANILASMYVDNSITTDFEFKTDKSLVWERMWAVFIRGDMTVTFHSAEHEAGDQIEELYDTFGIKAYYEEPLELMVDVGFEQDSSYSPSEMILYQYGE